MRTQDKFTAAMQSLADELDLDLVVDKSWSNVGTFRFQQHDSFASLLDLPFSFQDDYSSFHGGAGHGPLGPNRKGGSYSYVQGAEHEEIIAKVRSILTEKLADLPVGSS